MADQRDPDLTDDPRRKGASEQLPEESPTEREPRPGAGHRRERGEQGEAPSGSHPADGDPGQATGNPGAAGA